MGKPAPKPADRIETGPISLGAYAKRRGVSTMAVSKAIATGRLVASVVRVDGAPKIGDPELADREWSANSRPRTDQPGRSPPAALPPGVPDLATSRAIRAAAAARREAVLAELAEFELAERQGKYILVATVRDDVVRDYTRLRNYLFGVPSRLGQAGIDRAAIALVDEHIRRALSDLADGKDYPEP